MSNKDGDGGMKWSEMSERERDVLVRKHTGVALATSSISNAWQVVEKLKQMEYGVQIYCQNGFDWSVTLYEEAAHGSFETFDEPVEAKTAPEAICKAALLAVGVQIE